MKNDLGISTYKTIRPSIHQTFKRTPIANQPSLINAYFREIAIFNTPLENHWSNVKSTNKQQTYIIVIGESASRNHMSLYGYNRDTTPHLTTQQGMRYVNMAISPAATTRDSLLRILTLNDKSLKPQPTLNLIGLANAANMKTIWISNQGRIGHANTPIARLAKASNSITYLNKTGDYSVNYDDILLEPLTLALADPAPNKLIILHLMGSHLRFEDRAPKRFFHGRNNAIDFYDSSIYFTDQVLSAVVQQAHKAKAKVLYFSDHALRPSKVAPYLIHGITMKVDARALQVPLLFIDPNTTGQHKIDHTYYMFDMFHTIADWMNVDADGLTRDKSILNPTFKPENNSQLFYHFLSGENISASELQHL